MDNNKYPKIFLINSWLILLYFILFFLLFNILAEFLYNKQLSEEMRFKSPASQQEVMSLIEKINNDPRRKIIFLGGSAMWGGLGISRAEDTIPVQFKKHVAPGVGVYNMSYGAARPLDQLLILSQIKNYDLAIIDVNTRSYSAEANQGVKEDYSKYVRIQALLNAYKDDLFAKSTNIQRCLNASGLYPKQDYTSGLVKYVPLVKYKDEINNRFFGKSFPFVADYLLAGLLGVFKPNKHDWHWNLVFAPIKDDFTTAENTNILKDPQQKFFPTLNSCIDQAMNQYVYDNNLPVVFYLSPHSPLMTSLQRKDLVYNQNTNFVLGLFSSSTIIDFDSSTSSVVPYTAFVDELHFTVVGHKAITEALVSNLKQIFRYSVLLK
jgi:hypothetical protein